MLQIAMLPGDKVRLNTPDNPRLDGARAIVETTTEWGAHVLTDAAATGKFRALYSEMIIEREGTILLAEKAATHAHSNGGYQELKNPYVLRDNKQAKSEGYTGDACDTCGGLKMKRNGACLLCEDCGTSSGCS